MNHSIGIFDTGSPCATVTATSHVTALRAQMAKHDIDAWVITSADPHNSEYQAPHWQSRIWLSGFTGSAGTVVVLKDCAGLWTDGRYHIQAAKQLQGSGITLFKKGLPETPLIYDWIRDTLPAGATVGFDGKVIPAAALNEMQSLFSVKNISLKTNIDLIDQAWPERPPIPENPIFEHSAKFAGKTRLEKLHAVRQEMKDQNTDWLILNSLDDIAWLYNFRGSDIPNCPIALSYALVSQDKAWLCIDSAKVPSELAANFKSDQVTLVDYNDIYDLAKEIPATDAIVLNKQAVNSYLFSQINSSCRILDQVNTTTRMKAVKNSTEIAHFKNCLIRDGAYMVKFMKWLETNVPSGNVTERIAAEYLKSLRLGDSECHGLSFTTIPGYAANGALMHYGISDNIDVTVEESSFFLVDSGGLYSDGTTDITRTFSYGPLNEQEIRDYTLVLKGHINLARAAFLHGTRGLQLDILARGDMWREGINFGCGTGHGVGFFLNVHEGPHNIGPGFVDEAILPGMVVTNEPGIYREGVHGVRIENIMLCLEKEKTDFGAFYDFETITICPIETRSIDTDLLSNEEIDWLNTYHQKVFNSLSPLLDEEHQQYLKAKTQPISK